MQNNKVFLMAIASLYPSMQIYASDVHKSRGRKIFEAPSKTRTDFHRDRDRIIHSSAFRRLKGKTQVFIATNLDHFRTRLTHTLEVAQIARSLARALGLDEDLAETLALAHDLGHPPFGHVGEDALAEAMLPYGGFDHNAQTLRVVMQLERRYANFDGLNLTWETLEGLAKHNGPQLSPHPLLLKLNTLVDFELSTYASLEAQAAAIADDIAYNAHDIDDGLRSGLLNFSDLKDAALTRDILQEVDELYPNLEPQRRIYEVSRRLITALVEDVIEASEAQIALLKPKNVAAIRSANKTIIEFSAPIRAQERELKTLLRARLYRHPLMMPKREKAHEIILKLFKNYMQKGQHETPRHICDYIAGMSDQFAGQEWQKIV
jgi:dGTPase